MPLTMQTRTITHIAFAEAKYCNFIQKEIEELPSEMLKCHIFLHFHLHLLSSTLLIIIIIAVAMNSSVLLAFSMTMTTFNDICFSSINPSFSLPHCDTYFPE